jgi:tRNA_anti-like
VRNLSSSPHSSAPTALAGRSFSSDIGALPTRPSFRTNVRNLSSSPCGASPHPSPSRGNQIEETYPTHPIEVRKEVAHPFRTPLLLSKADTSPGVALLANLWHKYRVPVFLEKYILPILAGLTLLILVTNPMHFNVTQRIVSAVVALFLAVSASYAVQRQNRRKASYPGPGTLPLESSLAQLKDRRVLVAVEPGYLTSFFKDHTQLQAEKLVAVYIGKWIKVSGSLQDVFTSGKMVVVRVEGVPRLAYVMSGFLAEDWLDHVSVLRRGDRISLVGQITQVSSVSIYLENSQLIDSFCS